MYTVYHIATMVAVKSGLSITESVRLHNECGHVTYGIMSDAANAALVAAAERDALLETLDFLAAETGLAAYERAADDVRAGATVESLGGGWCCVQRPGRPAHLAHREVCDCRSRVFCRHAALAHAVAFQESVEAADVAA
jgi:hypothetical protein